MEGSTGERAKWGVATKEDFDEQIGRLAAKMALVEQSLRAGGNQQSLDNHSNLKGRRDKLRRLGFARGYLRTDLSHEEDV
jgi:hypothetical protein